MNFGVRWHLRRSCVRIRLMSIRLRPFFLSVLLAAVIGPVVSQQQRFPFDAYRDSSRVLIVFARDRNEDRVFSFHLALSERWESVARRNVVLQDILPGQWDLNAVARRLDLGDREFAVVLLDRNGDIVFTTSNENALGEILMHLDLLEDGN